MLELKATTLTQCVRTCVCANEFNLTPLPTRIFRFCECRWMLFTISLPTKRPWEFSVPRAASAQRDNMVNGTQCCCRLPRQVLAMSICCHLLRHHRIVSCWLKHPFLILVSCSSSSMQTIRWKWLGNRWVVSSTKLMKLI